MADDAVADAVWMQGVAREWNTELADPREDLYRLNDAEAIHAAFNVVLAASEIEKSIF